MWILSCEDTVKVFENAYKGEVNYGVVGKTDKGMCHLCWALRTR